MEKFPTFRAIAHRLRPASSPPGTLRGFDTGLFLRQLASMLRSGLTLPQALGFLAEDFRPPVAPKILAARARVEQGETFAAAAADLPEGWITPTDRAAIAAGERSGRLTEVLDELASDHERWRTLRSRIRSVLAYPTVVLVLAALICTLLLYKVLPTYASLYAARSVALPWPTRLLLAFSGFFGSYVLLLAGAWIAWRLWLRPRVVPRLPIAREVVQALRELRFTRLLGILVSSGMPLPEALELCAASVPDRAPAGELRRAAERITRGDKPSEALSELGFVSPVFLWFLRGSEERGDFVEVTRNMAELSEERLLAALERAQRTLEPVSVLGAGIVVGFVVVNLYVPMFRLISVVGN